MEAAIVVPIIVPIVVPIVVILALDNDRDNDRDNDPSIHALPALHFECCADLLAGVLWGTRRACPAGRGDPHGPAPQEVRDAPVAHNSGDTDWGLVVVFY